MKTTIPVKGLTLPECASSTSTLDLVQRVAINLGIPISLEHAVIGTPHKARTHRLIASPTVRVEMLDKVPTARQEPHFGLG